jgi:hypothetical protein
VLKSVLCGISYAMSDVLRAAVFVCGVTERQTYDETNKSSQFFENVTKNTFLSFCILFVIFVRL